MCHTDFTNLPLRAIPRTITLARALGVDAAAVGAALPSLNLTDAAAAAADSIRSAASKAEHTAVARLWSGSLKSHFLLHSKFLLKIVRESLNLAVLHILTC